MTKKLNIERLFKPQLLYDLIDYTTNQKALSVYRKCIRARKINLANKIAIKHKLRIHDDASIALGMALTVIKHKKERKE